MGETDGTPKDPLWTFNLYLELGNYRQASRIAVIIASGEQEEGLYKDAHEFLFDTYQQLRDKKLKVSQDLHDKLCLIHS